MRIDFENKVGRRAWKTVFMGAVLVAALAPSLLFAQSAVKAPVVNVPSAVSPDAAFEPAQANGAPAQEILEARGGDGAAVVLDEAAVITATGGSRLLTHKDGPSPEPIAVLLQGGFLLQVGSAPVRFVLGAATLTAKEAEILVVRVGADWLVEAVAFYEGGAAELTAPVPRPIPEPASLEHTGNAMTKKKEVKKGLRKEAGQNAEEKPPEEKAPAEIPEPMVQTLALVPGKILKTGPGSAVEMLAVENQPDLQRLAGRLTEPEPRGPLLAAVDVEDPDDFVARRIHKDAAFEEIEIEEIEIEAGCVEICLD